ncbi:MAG: amidohydrolase family protein [Bryobacteraceae bacterium]
MASFLSRREWLGGALAATAAQSAPRPKGVLVDSHVHLFADDQKRFPYHRNATYKPPAQPVEAYIRFAKEAKLAHALIVHPEPYQDDHRYLEYCFEREHAAGFFKGTCLLDPLRPNTPDRMEALIKKLPGRIVAIRIHENLPAGKAPAAAGPIRDRDLDGPGMKETWRAAATLGLAVQMHFIPRYAPQIAKLAAEFRSAPVILDHLARAGQGGPGEYDQVLRLAQFPQVIMKFSGIAHSSKQDHPYLDAKPLVRRAFHAFGADRIIWGGLGMNMAEFEKASALLDLMFDFAQESDRVKIRGANAMKLFSFRT